jgi:hypothetical protein
MKVYLTKVRDSAVSKLNKMVSNQPGTEFLIHGDGIGSVF